MYIDSAGSCHILDSRRHLHNTRKVKATVTAVGGQEIDLTHKGTALIDDREEILEKQYLALYIATLMLKLQADIHLRTVFVSND